MDACGANVCKLRVVINHPLLYAVAAVHVGLGLAKVVKLGRLPVKVQLAVQYMPLHPRISGQEWNVQISITPVIPKLIKGVLFK